MLSQHYKSVFTVDNGIMPFSPQLVPPNSLNTFNITENDIVKAVHKMNGQSSPGCDDIVPKFIKNVYPYLIRPLYKLFGMSLGSGQIPLDWKQGIIVPIYKKNGNPSSTSSYRPICLTSCVAKLLEKIVYDNILNHLNHYDILSKDQHGFLKQKSTITNLMQCTYDWTKALNDQKPVDALYIDFEKAFDKVSHEKLLFKMSKLGIGGVVYEWLENFLCNRPQAVRVGNNYSALQIATSGVAQGTLLGPLAFLLYINDMSNCVQTNSSTIRLFADDTKLYAINPTTDDCFRFYDDILSLHEWCEEWQVKMNYSKCNVLHLGPRNLNMPYRIENVLIPDVRSCRDLGVIISRNCKFEEHCRNISRNGHFKC